MAAMRIDGVAGFNGEYPLDMTYFTNREYDLIRRISGVRAGELQDGFAAGDAVLIMAVAVIMVWREKGTQPPLDPFWDAKESKFTLTADEEPEDVEDESLPPKIAPVEEITHDGTSETDGRNANGSSDDSASALRAIGAQG